MKKYQSFLSENYQFLEMKFSVYLNRRVSVMVTKHKFLVALAYYNYYDPVNLISVI